MREQHPRNPLIGKDSAAEDECMSGKKKVTAKGNLFEGSLQELLVEIESENAPLVAESLNLTRKQASRSNRRKLLHITFYLNDIELALPLDYIQEVDKLPVITPLPNLPSWILGLAQVRGEIITMIELRTLFRITYFSSVTEGNYYILISNGDLRFGFPVNRISGIIGIEDRADAFKSIPVSENGSDGEISSYISGTLAAEDRVLAVLDGEKLLHSSLLGNLTADVE